jgi:superfamily II DNA or RNA helicase
LVALQQKKNLVYALPTGGGKTLVAEMLILRELICCRKNAIFVVPYVAIVQEKVTTATARKIYSSKNGYIWINGFKICWPNVPVTLSSLTTKFYSGSKHKFFFFTL